MQLILLSAVKALTLRGARAEWWEVCVQSAAGAFRYRILPGGAAWPPGRLVGADTFDYRQRAILHLQHSMRQALLRDRLGVHTHYSLDVRLYSEVAPFPQPKKPIHCS